MAKALLLVDFEEEWRNTGSDYYLGKFSDKVKKARQLLSACRQKGVTVIFTRHIEPGSTTAFAEGSKNVEILDELKPLEREGHCKEQDKSVLWDGFGNLPSRQECR